MEYVSIGFDVISLSLANLAFEFQRMDKTTTKFWNTVGMPLLLASHLQVSIYSKLRERNIY